MIQNIQSYICIMYLKTTKITFSTLCQSLRNIKVFDLWKGVKLVLNLFLSTLKLILLRNFFGCLSTYKKRR